MNLSSLLPALKNSTEAEVEVQKKKRTMIKKEESRAKEIPLGVYNQQALVIPQERDEEGRIKYEVLARVGQPEGRQIKASLKDALSVLEKCKEKRPGMVPFYPMPPKEIIEQEIRETKAFIDSLINTGPLGNKKGNGGVQYLKYQDQGQETRVVRVTEAKVDPLEPPRFKHKKVPRPPPSPPAPVLHSPPRKPTQAAYNAWKVPACVSGWKNPKGYTIPLDKRMANNPRDALPVQVNEAFADVSQALYVAEKAAREQMERRLEMEKERERVKLEEKQEHLRRLAMNARQQNKRGTTFDRQQQQQRIVSEPFEIKYAPERDDDETDFQEYKEGRSILASGLLDEESSSAVHYDRPLFSGERGRGISSFHRVTVDEDTHGDKRAELAKLMRQADAVVAGRSSHTVKRKQEKEQHQVEFYGKVLEKRVDLTEPELLNPTITKDNSVKEAENTIVSGGIDVFGLDAFLSAARSSSSNKRKKE